MPVPANPAQYMNVIFHYILASLACIVAILGISGESGLLKQASEALSPISGWVAMNVPFIEGIAKIRQDQPHITYYLSLMYMACIMMYAHIVITSILNILNKEARYLDSYKGHRKFLYDTMYSIPSIFTKTICHFSFAAKQDHETRGSLIDGLCHYASKREVVAIYAVMIYVLFFSSFFIDSIATPGRIISFINPHIIYLMVIMLQISTIAEVAVHLVAMITKWRSRA